LRRTNLVALLEIGVDEQFGTKLRGGSRKCRSCARMLQAGYSVTLPFINTIFVICYILRNHCCIFYFQAMLPPRRRRKQAASQQFCHLCAPCHFANFRLKCRTVLRFCPTIARSRPLARKAGKLYIQLFWEVVTRFS
jgi:hypothetical protein